MENRCPKCNKTYLGNERYCIDCGVELVPNQDIEVKYCSNCSNYFPINYKFCTNCGSELALKKTSSHTLNDPSGVKTQKPTLKERVMHMFKHISQLEFERDFFGTLGFYTVYLSFIVVVIIFLSGITELFGLGFLVGARFGNIVGVICCSFLTSLIIYKKGLYSNLLHILLGLSAVVISIYAGTSTGMIIIAYQSSLRSNKTNESLIGWYHKPWFISCLILFSVLYITYSTYHPQNYSYYETPYQSIAKVFYAKKMNIYLPTIPKGGATYSNWEDYGYKRQLYPPESIAAYYRKATVLIRVYDKNKDLLGTGTGFAITSDGFIVTNYHVLSGAHSATVTLWNNKTFKNVYWVEKMLGQGIDLALIKINTSDLHFAMIGDSSKAFVGKEILVIGAPMGLEGTVTKGTISSYRDIGDIELMQISAPVSPGSSGGPVVNMYGEVVGVTTLASNSPELQNLNFAVPINYIKK